jgi:hypothetical protein
MIRRIRLWHIVLLGMVIAAGCQQSTDPSTNNNPVSDGSVETNYLLADEPDGAKSVMDLKQNAKDGDDVLIVGRVGGDKKPFLEGLAGFTIVDTSLKSCADIPGDTCPTPWDYCCEDPTEVKRGKALVKIVDAGGNTVKKDARELIGVSLLQTVVVRGKAKRDDEGNLTVLASAVHVRGK